MTSILFEKRLSKEDAQRLESSFFTQAEPGKEKKFKKPNKKIFLATVAGLIIILALSGLIFIRYYRIVILPEPKLALNSKSVDLLFKDNLKEIKFINSNKNSLMAKNAIFLSIEPSSQEGFKLSFKQPLNLEDSLIAIYLQDLNVSGSIKTILKDKDFFSNAQNPIEIDLDKVSTGITELQIPIKKAGLPARIDLRQIEQVSFYLENNENIQASPIIKNILLIQKEETQ